MDSYLVSSAEREFEILLRDGITAAKSDQRRLAQSLLRRASMLDPSDARPYVWLSATTDDPQERREYLEQAVAVDPTNVAARRGLAALSGKIDSTRLMPEGAGVLPRKEVHEVAAEGQVFLCPKCGGRSSYLIQGNSLTCEYCGYTQPNETDNLYSEYVADRAEQVLEFVTPTSRGHVWAESRHRLTCQRCGASSLLKPGSKSTRCPYCGSNQVIDSPELVELIEPKVVAVFKIDEKQALQRARKWLGGGLFSPDNLLAASGRLKLQPAYYSAWTFDGLLEISWTCEVNEGSGRYAHWVARSGSEGRFFNDVLVSGVRLISQRELESLEPFDWESLQPFSPELLAGWDAMIYDRSLTDASLLGREKALRILRPQVNAVIEPGREKRHVATSAGNWSGMTFKHVLLPIWTGTYNYQGKAYRLLINGQTGKVSGGKPRDLLKIMLGIFSALLIFFLVAWLILHFVR